MRERFGEDRNHLTANSWGTVPSLFVVPQAPEPFHAYVGTGQMDNNRATDRRFYESSHRPSFEQPADFAGVTRDVVAASASGES